MASENRAVRDAHDARWPTQLLPLAGIACTGVLASALVGATTNAINGAVSPTYFIRIMDWQGVKDVWRASIGQGILEGLAFGVIFSLVFTVGTGIITIASCSFRFAFKHMLGVIAFGCCWWALGGYAGVGLAACFPEFYERHFHSAPSEFWPMLDYAWVGGSIWGAEVGGFVATILGLVVLRANWLSQFQAKTISRSEARKPLGDAAITLALVAIGFVLIHAILHRLRSRLPRWLELVFAWIEAVTGTFGAIIAVAALVLAATATFRSGIAARGALLMWGIVAAAMLAFVHLLQVRL